MDDYIIGLDRTTYDFSKDGKIARPKNDDSHKSIKAVFSVLDRAEEIGVIVDEVTKGSVHMVKLTHVDTRAEAVLSINYGGSKGYHAKVILGNGQQVSVENGSDIARKIANYLKAPKQHEAKKKTGKVPIVGRELVTVLDARDKYDDLEKEFEE